VDSLGLRPGSTSTAGRSPDNRPCLFASERNPVPVAAERPIAVRAHPGSRTPVLRSAQLPSSELEFSSGNLHRGESEIGISVSEMPLDREAGRGLNLTTAKHTLPQFRNGRRAP